jgi:hypothetical protein
MPHNKKNPEEVAKFREEPFGGGDEEDPLGGRAAKISFMPNRSQI